MKISREIKVGLLAIAAIAVAYWGFNFLKGVNLLSPTYTYYGVWYKMNGLTEQSPVYVKGYKVGQVDKILYDFTKEESFLVTFSIDKHIVLPQGTELALVSDGLLGGSALELKIPSNDSTPFYHSGDTLQTSIVPGLMDNLESNLLASVSTAIQHLDTLLVNLTGQIDNGSIERVLDNVDRATADLTASTTRLKGMMQNEVPAIVTNLDSTMTDVRGIAHNLSETDLAATIDQLDGTIANLKRLTETINSTDGTLGLLLNDKAVYDNLNHAVNSADSLLTDIKANPKRYINISVFGKSK